MFWEGETVRLLAINHPTRPPTPPRSHFRDHFDHMQQFLQLQGHHKQELKSLDL